MKPKVTRDDKIMLWQLLSRGQWLKAKELAPHWGNKPGNTRIIRAICEAEPDKFISSQKGYKRVDLATDEDLQTAYNDLISRAGKIKKRALAIDKAMRDRRQLDMVS